jgi:hypothetical protein
MVLPKELVQEFGSWPGKRRQQIHEDKDRLGHVAADLEAISDTNRLRNHLAEDY